MADNFEKMESDLRKLIGRYYTTTARDDLIETAADTQLAIIGMLGPIPDKKKK